MLSVMKFIRLLLPALLALGLHTAFAADAGPKSTGTSVRVRFVPVKVTDGRNKASFTALAPMKEMGGVRLMAHAGAGESFPVTELNGPTLFEVAVIDGDDEHLALEIRAKEGVQKVECRRDKASTVMVAGVRYEILFPNVSVASTGKATTEQAMIIFSRRP